MVARFGRWVAAGASLDDMVEGYPVADTPAVHDGRKAMMGSF